MFGAAAVITELIVLQQTGELWEAVRIAAETIFTPRNALFLLAGVLLGLLMGALPGLGGPVALALLIPLTYPLGVNVSIMILAATLLDGYPLARQGRATEALSTSAIASASGAILGLFLFLASVPIVRQFALLFHSVDIFWLAVFGLVTVAVVSRGGIAANLVAGGVGLLLAFHGFNQVTGTARFTWGTTYLRDGIQLIPLLIGLFAVAEMLRLASERTTVSSVDIGSGGTLAGAKIVFENRLVFLQSSIVGWLIGVVPGAGGTVANFVAYLQAQNISSDPESFGTGNVRGVIASEAANDAKDGGSMIPTLGLGIPGSASTAVLLGAFVVNGVIPGPQLFQENLQLVFIVIFGLLLSNVLTSAIGILLARQIARLTRVSVTTLVPIILFVALLGAFVNRGNFGDVTATVVFGVIGFYMLKFNVSRIPVVIAFVLGPIAEQNFHRSLQISRGAYSIFLERHVSIVLIVATVAVLLLPFVRYARRRRSDER